MTPIRIGITGARGFIGQHLAARLDHATGISVITAGRNTFQEPDLLRDFVAESDTIVHLAGMNRGAEQEVEATNMQLAGDLVQACQHAGRRPHIIYASSTQAALDTPYGRSKQAAGNKLMEWSLQGGGPVTVLTIPNVYGAGCRPFYNSVVATFCHQLTHGLEPTVHQDKELELLHVDELVDIIQQLLAIPAQGVHRKRITGSSQMSVSDLLSMLTAFRDAYFDAGVVPELTNTTARHLYATFLSYVDPEALCHRPPLHTDPRGSLVEVIKLAQGGQVFFSTTKPGVVRGDHFHTRKIEWFCVLRGEAVIRLRRVGANEIQEFYVSGQSPQFISIPVFHTHHIENVGDDELLTMFWCNEIFDQANPDTYFEKVA